MNAKLQPADRRRAVVLAAAIASSLIVLALAITQRSLTANGSPGLAAKPDFVVSSDRDSGPGTLRDAILAADRLTSRARILISVPRIALESPLPALVNPHGVDIAVAAGGAVLDAERQESGGVLQIQSPGTIVRGLRIVNARSAGVIVAVTNVKLEGVSVGDSKVGILVGAAARDCTILTSVLEGNETGVLVEPGAQRISVMSSIFRGNTRAGFWLVGPAAQPRRAGQAAAPAAEPVRIADSVFENNASGAVVANQLTSIRKSRFIGNRESAVLVLGGAAQLEDNEIRTSTGAAISVTSGHGVVLSRNTLLDNVSSAISVRDSDVRIEGNTLRRNGFGIVAISSGAGPAPAIRENLVTETKVDAVTLIGGTTQLQRNRIIGNRGVGLRVLDLVQGRAETKALPGMEGNVIKDNAVDAPVTGTYKLPEPS